jgi:hypothetical protein
LSNSRISSFTSHYDQLSRVLKNNVHISQAFDPTVGNESIDCKNEFEATWDTGATNTVVSPKVILACNLLPIGMDLVHHADGEVKAEKFIINLYLPNNLVVYNLPVICMNLFETDVLIGMDVITKGDFAISNFNGKTVFSFRFPSICLIDFVAMSKSQQLLPHENISRNSLCPCGSGKKYKRCCGSS